jgi:hypothetical protein
VYGFAWKCFEGKENRDILKTYGIDSSDSERDYDIVQRLEDWALQTMAEVRLRVERRAEIAEQSR